MFVPRYGVVLSLYIFTQLHLSTAAPHDLLGRALRAARCPPPCNAKVTLIGANGAPVSHYGPGGNVVIHFDRYDALARFVRIAEGGLTAYPITYGFSIPSASEWRESYPIDHRPLPGLKPLRSFDSRSVEGVEDSVLSGQREIDSRIDGMLSAEDLEELVEMMSTGVVGIEVLGHLTELELRLLVEGVVGIGAAVSGLPADVSGLAGEPESLRGGIAGLGETLSGLSNAGPGADFSRFPFEPTKVEGIVVVSEVGDIVALVEIENSTHNPVIAALTVLYAELTMAAGELGEFRLSQDLFGIGKQVGDVSDTEVDDQLDRLRNYYFTLLSLVEEFKLSGDTKLLRTVARNLAADERTGPLGIPSISEGRRGALDGVLNSIRQLYSELTFYMVSKKDVQLFTGVRRIESMTEPVMDTNNLDFVYMFHMEDETMESLTESDTDSVETVAVVVHPPPMTILAEVDANGNPQPKVVSVLVDTAAALAGDPGSVVPVASSTMNVIPANEIAAAPTPLVSPAPIIEAMVEEEVAKVADLDAANVAAAVMIAANPPDDH